MKKIDLIELMDENNTKPKDKGETWIDVLENIKRESNNFDLETMCNICIKQQYELGIKDKDGNLITSDKPNAYKFEKFIFDSFKLFLYFFYGTRKEIGNRKKRLRTPIIFSDRKEIENC